jgi:hypothetical protein
MLQIGYDLIKGRTTVHDIVFKGKTLPNVGFANDETVAVDLHYQLYYILHTVKASLDLIKA